ncbi:Lar family restriction alleviation protein [Caldimonas tepidiphila]|uniref:Lar family restriction alleviation protein n=1 Tax=Caldimonas tepidiphila TaxID=2315841 RepID=UPI000E5C0695|nr:Lar family restriction alleviation protein [Caldimonas tepidiphila]
MTLRTNECRCFDEECVEATSGFPPGNEAASAPPETEARQALASETPAIQHHQQQAQLLPCPHCGAEPLIHDIQPHAHSFNFGGWKMPDHPGSTVIECGCGAGMIDESRERVLERWNRRAAAPQPLDALRWAHDWIDAAPHGDNCYLSDHYEGDPGNQCNCDKESILAALEPFLDAPQPAAAQPISDAVMDLVDRLAAECDTLLRETAAELGCEPDNEAILEAIARLKKDLDFVRDLRLQAAAELGLRDKAHLEDKARIAELQAEVERAAAAEREACAALCESTYPGLVSGERVELPCFDTPAECAAAIRARTRPPKEPA